MRVTKYALTTLLALAATFAMGEVCSLATEVSATVDASCRAQPWDTTVNSGYGYGINDGESATMVDSTSGFVFAAGNSFTLKVTGTVQAGGFGL
jgi:hypothetical protein